jgi:hypothetical protein
MAVNRFSVPAQPSIGPQYIPTFVEPVMPKAPVEAYDSAMGRLEKTGEETQAAEAKAIAEVASAQAIPQQMALLNEIQSRFNENLGKYADEIAGGYADPNYRARLKKDYTAFITDPRVKTMANNVEQYKEYLKRTQKDDYRAYNDINSFILQQIEQQAALGQALPFSPQNVIGYADPLTDANKAFDNLGFTKKEWDLLASQVDKFGTLVDTSGALKQNSAQVDAALSALRSSFLQTTGGQNLYNYSRRNLGLSHEDAINNINQFLIRVADSKRMVERTSSFKRTKLSDSDSGSSTGFSGEFYVTPTTTTEGNPLLTNTASWEEVKLGSPKAFVDFKNNAETLARYYPTLLKYSAFRDHSDSKIMPKNIHSFYKNALKDEEGRAYILEALRPLGYTEQNLPKELDAKTFGALAARSVMNNEADGLIARMMTPLVDAFSFSPKARLDNAVQQYAGLVAKMHEEALEKNPKISSTNYGIMVNKPSDKRALLSTVTSTGLSGFEIRNADGSEASVDKNEFISQIQSGALDVGITPTSTVVVNAGNTGKTQKQLYGVMVYASDPTNSKKINTYVLVNSNPSVQTSLAQKYQSGMIAAVDDDVLKNNGLLDSRMTNLQSLGKSFILSQSGGGGIDDFATIATRMAQRQERVFIGNSLVAIKGKDDIYTLNQVSGNNYIPITITDASGKTNLLRGANFEDIIANVGAATYYYNKQMQKQQ